MNDVGIYATKYMRSVKKRPTREFELLLKKAKKLLVDPEAQFNCGMRYYRGDGIIANDKEAFFWFLKSAQNCHPMGQYYCANMLHRGIGTSRNVNQAIRWYKESIRNEVFIGRCALREAQIELGYTIEIDAKDF